MEPRLDRRQIRPQNAPVQKPLRAYQGKSPMKLPSSIEFKFATLSEFSHYPNEDGGKAVLCIASPLTPELAQSLDIREQFYDAKGLSREFTTRVGLVCDPTDTDCRIRHDGGDVILKPEKIHSFGVKREKHGEGTQLVLDFRVHLATPDAIDAAYAFSREINKNCFGCALVNKQGALPFDEEPVEKQEVRGKKGAVASKSEMKIV
jgi:hypothetical protein